MRLTLPILLAAALAAPAAPAEGAISDFRLPPDTSQQEPPPDRQGPVAPDVPESRRPPPTPVPAAREPEQAPAPVITPPPLVVPPVVAETPGITSIQTPDTPQRPAMQPTSVPSPLASEASPTDLAPLPPAPTTRPAPARTAIEGERALRWPWVMGGVLAFCLAGLATWTWLRRRQARPKQVLEVERPKVAPSFAPEAPAVPAPSPSPRIDEPLQVSLEPLRLSLTLMNATLNWRLRVSNFGSAPLTRLAIGADMISAHASLSREEQLSGPGGGAGPLAQIDRLEPGESRAVEGEFRLPLGQIVPIRQGSAALLVPLARFRVEAEGTQPLVRTFAVGQPGNGSALQPFRLDQGPRIYPSLTHRAFAQVYPGALAR